MFYMEMLREQDELMGNTGFDPDMVVNSDDKYAIDLKDIAQTVEDINDDYADQSSQEELDGQDLAEDPVAEAMIAVYENEYNWNLVMESIGTHELLEYARGREMVMEAVDVKGFIEKAKEFFVNMFRKITDTVTEFLQKHSATARISMAFAKKYKKDIEKGEADYKALVAKGKKKALEGYSALTKLDEIADTISTIEASAVDTKNMPNSYEDMKKFAETKDLEANESIKDFSDGNASNLSDFRKWLEKNIFGTKGTLSEKAASGSNAIKILENGVQDMHKIKNAYTKVKRSFDDLIKCLNKAKDFIPKAEKQGDVMKGLNAMIAYQKTNKNAIHVMYSVVMKAMRARQAQALRIAHAYAGASGALKKVTDKESKETKKQEVQHNSAGFFGNLELL